MDLNLKLLQFPKFLELRSPISILERPICLDYEEVISRNRNKLEFSSNGTIFVRFDHNILYSCV